MFAASWLYSQGLLAVGAPRYEMSSFAGLNARGWAMSPAIQPTLNVTKARGRRTQPHEALRRVRLGASVPSFTLL
jgi:hypothetical protein